MVTHDFQDRCRSTIHDILHLLARNACVADDFDLFFDDRGLVSARGDVRANIREVGYVKQQVAGGKQSSKLRATIADSLTLHLLSNDVLSMDDPHYLSLLSLSPHTNTNPP